MKNKIKEWVLNLSNKLSLKWFNKNQVKTQSLKVWFPDWKMYGGYGIRHGSTVNETKYNVNIK